MSHLSGLSIKLHWLLGRALIQPLIRCLKIHKIINSSLLCQFLAWFSAQSSTGLQFSTLPFFIVVIFLRINDFRLEGSCYPGLNHAQF